MATKKSSEYWQGRFDQVEQSANNKSVKHIKQLEKKYKIAAKEIDTKINAWYQRIAANNEITVEEARRLLSNNELAEFKWDVQQYIEAGQQNAIDQRWMKELENASAKFHINRLEALKLECRQQIEVAMAGGQEAMFDTLADVYKDSFYQSCFEVQKGFGVGFDVSALDDGQVAKIINKPWSVDGENFSSKVWKNRTKLINTLDQELTKMVLTGSTPQKAIQNIKKAMDTSLYNAKRLVLTEQAYFTTLGQKDAFKELDVEEYEIVSTLDNKTSEICQQMDGQHFPLKDMQPGVNAPPFHVFCRSTTCPYFDDEFSLEDKRVAKGEDGEWYELPGNISYPEWKKSFVEGGNKADLKPVTYEGGIPKNWKTIDVKEDNALQNTNPKFGTDIGYSKNCPNCACAYEMRKRGYDVTARPYVKGGSHYLNEKPWDAWEGADVQPIANESDLFAFTQKEGNGARFGIAIEYADKSGHVIVGEVVDNILELYDPQTGKKFNGIDFNDINSVQLWQTNELKLSDRGITACESR